MSTATARTKHTRGTGRRSIYALIAERETAKERTIISQANTITKQAEQISSLRRALAESVAKQRSGA